MDSSNTPRQRKVLLIDDNEVDNFVNQKLIEAGQFAADVCVKTNIPAALEYLYTLLRKNEKPPDVVFLDLNLPQYDGFHFLLEFKQMMYKYEELKDVEIIILSAFFNKYAEMAFNNFPFVSERLQKPLTIERLAEIEEKLTHTETAI